MGPRTKQCKCGHEFFKTVSTQKEDDELKGAVKTAADKAKATGGNVGAAVVNAAAKTVRKQRGAAKRKRCPKCDTVTLASTAKCECGHKFISGGADPPWDKKTPRPPKKKGAPPKIAKPFEGLTASPAEVVGIQDREALKSFIKQLQECYKHSDYSGGCYSAFLHHRHGTLRVEVWLTLDPGKLAKVKKAGT